MYIATLIATRKDGRNVVVTAVHESGNTAMLAVLLSAKHNGTPTPDECSLTTITVELED